MVSSPDSIFARTLSKLASRLSPSIAQSISFFMLVINTLWNYVVKDLHVNSARVVRALEVERVS